MEKANTELRAVPEPPDQVSKLSPQDEPPRISLESSSPVDEVAEELWHLQLPQEQPQQGVADDRVDMPNEEPLRKCSVEDDDAIRGTIIEAAVARIAKEPTKDYLQRGESKELSQEENETPKQRPLIGRAQGRAPLWDSKGTKQLSSRPFKVVSSQRFQFNWLHIRACQDHPRGQYVDRPGKVLLRSCCQATQAN